MSENKEEKREFERTNINIPIKYKVEDSEKIYQTLLHDISEGGIRLMSKVLLPRFKKIFLELSSLKDKKSIFTSGYLTWFKKHRAHSKIFEAGIKFDKLEKDEKKYIQDYLADLKNEKDEK